ncbi:MAG: response regulator, partial [Methyloprofundus sp.]|nr:response regulator [Methyloprofundus sp.]
REQKDYLNRIDSSGLHLLELINDVLDLSTIESGKTNLNIESVDLVGLVNESLELIVPQAYKAQITLENQLLNKEPSYIKADASRLHQVLANLLSNAIKYNWANGIISVWLAQQNGKVRLFIKNTGLGIPENKIADLFQPFQRLAADRASIEGTGIGLTITKMLVELMGGKIGVENDEGDSCTFWIEWALQESTVAPKELMRESLIVDSEPTHAAETGVNILYIEDNPSNRLLMKKMITRRTAFTYYEAKTGKEGAQIALQLQPNIILLDINLPDMTGIEVFEYLQENNLSKMTKVIAVSANAMQNDIDKGKAIGFFDYITKPIDQKQLFACIELALN